MTWLTWGRGRYERWPIRIGLSPRGMRLVCTWHGWQVGYETVPPCKTSGGCIPGVRAVYGRTLTIGPLQIRFGKHRDDLLKRTESGETCGCVSEYECMHRYHIMAERHAIECNRRWP